jgi:flagellar protein FlaG
MAIQLVTAPPAVAVSPPPGRHTQPADAAQTEPAPAALPAEQLEKLVQQVRQAVHPMAQNLLFSVDKDSGRTVVKVVDANTNELIRQIPSEEVLAISQALEKLEGLLLDGKA